LFLRLTTSWNELIPRFNGGFSGQAFHETSSFEEDVPRTPDGTNNMDTGVSSETFNAAGIGPADSLRWRR